jgi:2-aminoadipate transaminase
VAQMISNGDLWSHVARLRAAYRERRAAMLTALDAGFPAVARWTQPAGGMFVWVELPERIDTEALLSVALEEEQIAFIPGRAFAVTGCRARHCLRLSFSNVTPERITDGIHRLGRVVANFV